MIQLLNKHWTRSLASVFSAARQELFISSPYVTKDGSSFLLKNLSKDFLENGHLTFLTNLSAQNIVQGSTDPQAIQQLTKAINNNSVWHLPSLHAKVYIQDKRRSIITSANFTAGGFFNNYEYGVCIDDEPTSLKVFDDVFSYSQLGSRISDDALEEYVAVSNELKTLITAERNEVQKSIRDRLREVNNRIAEALIKPRLVVGATHNVFSKTIRYVLEKEGPLSTVQLHSYVQQIHPDLCDDLIDRVIDGKHYGKKWKHYVRNSQQHLKAAGIIKLEDGKWQIVR